MARFVPTATPVSPPLFIGRVGVPVDANGVSLIPELVGREAAATTTEQFLISGQTITFGSTNVKDMWWNWRNRDMFVHFLDGSLYVYHAVPLSIATGFFQANSPGRYVWSVLRVGWPTPVRATRLSRGTARRRPQVIRVIQYGAKRPKGTP